MNRAALSFLALASVLAANTQVISAESPASAIQRAPPEERFKQLDADGDGKVTLEEYRIGRTQELKSGPPPGAPAQAGRPQLSIEETFRTIDLNADGVISKAEFLARFANYQGWQAAHPRYLQEVEQLKARTAAMIGRERPLASTAATPPSAPRYGALIERSRKLSPSLRKKTAGQLTAAVASWNAADFAAAEVALRQVLAVDPANADANFYYADCLVRRRKNSSGAEFMNRAAILGADTPTGVRANAALDATPAAPGFAPPQRQGGNPGAVPDRRPPGPPRPLLTLRQQIPAAVPPGVERAPLIWRVPGAITEIRDCADCPVMSIVPAGEFTMGSPVTEAEREANEGPEHRVRIAYPFAVGKHAITRSQYAQFANETNWPDPPECIAVAAGGFPTETRGLSWRNPGFEQTDDSAAVCINWQDAEGYTAWLSKKTGHPYRLLSEAEYEYADRAGTTTAYWWGDDMTPGKAHCKGCDSAQSGQTLTGAATANPFGLYDINGNIWEMVADCYHDSYEGAPTDGSPWMTGTCERRVLKGGSFVNTPDNLRSAIHFRVMSEVANHSFLGFRVARTL